MVYTVTFSPALDYVMRLPRLVPGEVNRSREERIGCGGKGINVSIVLKHLGIESVALGFVAGFTGDEIERSLRTEGIQTDFVRTSGLSRINVKLKADSETDINGQGARISEQNLTELFRKLGQIPSESVLVLAGAVPKSLPSDLYEKILSRLESKNLTAAVDATGELLRNVLKFRPFLVKPNHHELGELFGVELRTRAEIEPYACKLRGLGAKNVLVSMAGEGALLAAEDGEVYFSRAPKGKVVDSVGAGDSMVAGFLAGKLNGLNYAECFRLGIASGSASAFSNELAQKSEIEALLKTF